MLPMRYERVLIIRLILEVKLIAFLCKLKASLLTLIIDECDNKVFHVSKYKPKKSMIH